MAWLERGSDGAPVPSRGATSDPHFARATDEIVARLARRGVRLSSQETGEQLADVLDAVERVGRAGGKLLVDALVPGQFAPITPDDPACVLPVRVASETVATPARVDASAAGDCRTPSQAPRCKTFPLAGWWT